MSPRFPLVVAVLVLSLAVAQAAPPSSHRAANSAYEQANGWSNTHNISTPFTVSGLSRDRVPEPRTLMLLASVFVVSAGTFLGRRLGK